jgi:hypothetical protein
VALLFSWPQRIVSKIEEEVCVGPHKTSLEVSRVRCGTNYIKVFSRFAVLLSLSLA